VTRPNESVASKPLSLIGAFSLMLVAAFLWGLSFPLIKGMADAFPPTTLASLRGGISCLALLAWFLVLRESVFPQSGRELLDWVILGAVNGWIANLLVNSAMQTLPGGQAALIQSCGPLITAVLASVLFADERLTVRRLVGIAIGFAGVALLIGPKLLGTGGTPLAAIAMLGVAISYASGNIYVRLLPVADPKRLALGQQVMSGLFATLIAIAWAGPASYQAFAEHPVRVLLLGIVSTAAPIVLYMIAIRALGPTRASLTGYLVPAWAVALSAILMGESVGLREALAGAIILAGVYIVTARREPVISSRSSHS
jgi:drug/metabolite transporter (DMT)-like permease